MIIDCKIEKVLQPIHGFSKSGNEYYRQPIVVSFAESIKKRTGETLVIEHSIKVELFGDIAKNFTLDVGTYISLDVRFDTNVFEGKDYQNISSRYLVVRSA